MAMTNGLDLPIINPLDQELMAAIDAFNVLFNYDRDATNYIQKQSNQAITNQSKSSDFSLNDIIIHGLKEEVVNATKKQLEKQSGLQIINQILIPALNMVGKQYENNVIFLPQLIQAAETSKMAFSVIKETFKELPQLKVQSLWLLFMVISMILVKISSKWF